ncbi:MAG: YcnI family protein [Rhodopila sp.]|nr:YcnI family protein [Rhodopila sp.]
MPRLSARVVALALIGLSSSAFAHVTAHPASGAADSYFETAFNVPHGCDGSSTVAVRIKIPEGVMSVKPQFKAGWTVTIKKRTLDAPVRVAHGRTITETVDEVDWEGGPLPDSMYDSFGMLMKLPGTAGVTLYFPVVQECQQGVHRWIEIPPPGKGWSDMREPPPFVKVVPATP